MGQRPRANNTGCVDFTSVQRADCIVDLTGKDQKNLSKSLTLCRSARSKDPYGLSFLINSTYHYCDAGLVATRRLPIPPYPRSHLSSFVQAWRVVTRHAVRASGVACLLSQICRQLSGAWSPEYLGEVSTSVSPSTVGNMMMMRHDTSDNSQDARLYGTKASMLGMPFPR